MMARAARSEPPRESDAASAGTALSIGSMGSGCPITPVEATITSRGAMPSARPAASHIRRALAGPSAVQVLALPLLQITACALPSFRFSRVTARGAPLTLLLV